MLWYHEAPLPLPEVCPGTLGQDILWRLPSEHRIHQMLRNPCYAGALVYGRTAAKIVIVDGRARQSPSPETARRAVADSAVGQSPGVYQLGGVSAHATAPGGQSPPAAG